MFQNILVPVDGSDYSYNAARLAAAIAKKFEGKVTLIHVVDLSIVTSFYPSGALLPTITDAMTEEWKKKGEEVLRSAREINNTSDVEIRCELNWGNPAQVISDRVKQGIDLVVMGSRGQGAISEFFLGSVSSRISHSVACPVLLVKEV